MMEEILDDLVVLIKQDERYLAYIEAQDKLDIEPTKGLLKDYHDKLLQYEDLKQYGQYIDNEEIKLEIRQLKREIADNQDIVDYYQKYHSLNDFLEEITKLVFGNISPKLDLSPYQL